MNIDLIIIFKVALTLYVVVALQFNQPTHFLLHCYHFSNTGSTLLNSINEVLGIITNLSDRTLVKMLLFADQNYTQVVKTHI